MIVPSNLFLSFLVGLVSVRVLQIFSCFCLLLTDSLQQSPMIDSIQQSPMWLVIVKIALPSVALQLFFHSPTITLAECSCPLFLERACKDSEWHTISTSTDTGHQWDVLNAVSRTSFVYVSTRTRSWAERVMVWRGAGAAPSAPNSLSWLAYDTVPSLQLSFTLSTYSLWFIIEAIWISCLCI